MNEKTDRTVPSDAMLVAVEQGRKLVNNNHDHNYFMTSIPTDVFDLIMTLAEKAINAPADRGEIPALRSGLGLELRQK